MEKFPSMRRLSSFDFIEADDGRVGATQLPVGDDIAWRLRWNPCKSEVGIIVLRLLSAVLTKSCGACSSTTHQHPDPCDVDNFTANQRLSF